VGELDKTTPTGLGVAAVEDEADDDVLAGDELGIPLGCRDGVELGKSDGTVLG
jgi:hypothetical protein